MGNPFDLTFNLQVDKYGRFTIPNPNTNDAMLNSVQNELGQSANNIPFELNDMIQKARQEAQQSGNGGEGQQGSSGGGNAIVDPNTLHQTYINNITEVKESISKAREKIQEEYAKVYQEKQEALDALESDPESGVSSEIIQEIRNQTLTPKEFGETLKKVGEEYKWIEFLGEMVAEDFLAPPEDYEKIYTKLIEVGHNKATVQALKTEGRRHKSAIKDIIEKYYDPKSANAGQSKIIIKSFIEEGKVHGKTISKIMPEVYDPLSYLDNMTTVTEERFLGFKLDPKYVADKAKSGKFNALLKATGRELAVKNLAKNFGIWANIIGTTAVIGSDINQYGSEWANLLKPNGWDNMSQEARDAFVNDFVDGAITGIDIAVSAMFTPVAGLVIGTGLQAVGALVKTLYQKTQYDNLDFVKMFWKNCNPFSDGNLVFKQDSQSTDMDTFLEGYVQEFVLQGYVQEVVLQGYTQKTVLQGEVQETVLQGSIQEVLLKGYTQDVVLRGHVNYFANVDDHAKINTDSDNRNNGMDLIFNYSSDTSIHSGNGSDIVYHHDGSNVSINTNQDDDYIFTQEGSDLTINAGNGSDTVINNSSNSFIDVGAGNDYVYNDSLGTGSTIDGGNDNDTLENRATNVSINGGSGDNKIVNDGENVTMIGGDGADTIANAGNAALINAGNGNNSIGNAGNEVSILSGIGNDTLINEGSKVTINIAGVNNAVTNKGAETSVIVASGNNTINNYAESSNIKGGSGADFIENGAIHTTINGGASADTIVNYGAYQIDDSGNITDVIYNGNKVLIDGGADNDLIENYGSHGTINGGTGDDSIKNFSILLVDQNGNVNIGAPITNYEYLLDAGEGNNYVYNENENATITSGNGHNLIENIANNVEINSGNGYDTIKNLGDNVNIDAGEGFNTIANIGNTVEISSGTGNDSIENDGIDVIILAGAGNDSIRNYSSDTTINAGAGNDIIFLESGAQNNVINYKVSDGNDIIYGYNSTTKIKIRDLDFNVTQSGNDKIINVGNGKITLKDAAGFSNENIIKDDDIFAGTEDADTISINTNNTTVRSFGGDDLIENSGSSVSVYGGTGNDTINSGLIVYNDVVGPFEDSVTVYSTGGTDNLFDGGDGDDVISNTGMYIWDATSQSYKLSSVRNNSTLLGGKGNDTIENWGTEVYIDGGANVDHIDNRASNVTIDGNNGNDSIENTGNDVSINGGIGDDKIRSSGDNVTVIGGAGDDQISTGGENILVDSGEGDDYINHGSPIDNSGTSSTILSGAGNDTIINYSSDVLIDGGSGNNRISNSYSQRVTINTGENNDSVYASFANSSINTEAGKDSIRVDCSENITINSGADDDTIEIGCVGHNFHDEIVYFNLVENATVNAGDGNNVITNNGGKNITFIFNESTNSTINGFNETSKIIFGNGNETYSITEIDNDSLKIVSNNKVITITERSNISKININGQEQDITVEPQWYCNGTTANYGTSIKTLITVTGLKSNAPVSGISLSGSVVTLSNSVLNQGTISVSNGYTLQLADDVPKSSITNANWSVSGTTATYKASATSAGYSLSSDGKTINYTNASGGNTLVTVSGLKSNAPVSGISLNGNVVTLSNSVLNEGTVSVSNGYTLQLADDVPKSSITNANWSVSGTTATYKASATSAGYSLSSDGKTINYTNAIGGNTLVTITGLKNNAALNGINLSGNVVTLSNSVLNQGTVSVSNGYTLQLADDVPKSTITNAAWSVSGTTATYKANATSAGYSLSSDGKTINYTSASGGNTLVTVSGLKSNAPVSGISLNGNVITLSNSVLNQGTITVSNGYTLKLADDVAKSTITNAAWSVSGTTATYKANATSAGYSLSSDGKTINYTSASGGNTLVTVSGLKSNAPVSGISLNGNVITLSNSVLNQGTVSVSNGYTLKLADDVAKSTITNAAWSVSGTTATYKANATSAGYSISSDGKTINYTNASGGNTLVTITGLKNNAALNGISLSGNVVTLSNSVLNQGTVTVSNGYTLKLADDVLKSTITNAAWSVSGTTATYKANATSAGYALSSDGKTAIYANASGGNTLVTVSGLKSNAPVSGISLNGNVITLSNSVLNQGTVTVSNGYTLKLADDVPKTTITNAAWSVSGTTATYKASATSAGYSLSSDGKTINYTNASGGNTLVTVSGLKSNAPVSGISLNGNTVTLSNSVLNQGTVSVSKGYTLKLADDVPKSSITNANWSVSGTTATYKASATSAGYSLSSDGKTINYTNASGGNTLVTVSGLKSNAPVSGISLNGNTVTLSNSVLNQGTISVSNGYTLKLADDVPKSSITNANWSVSGTTATYKASATSAGYSLSSDGKTINYTNASGGNTLVTVSGLKSNAPVSGISLNGNIVTLSNSVLNQGTVSVSNGYTLQLADDVPKSSITNANWSVNGTTATYKANATSAGYSLSSDGKTINYTKASGGNTLVTVTGLKSNAPVSGISLNGTVVTLSNSVLNQGTVTVSNGYTLKLADDVPKSSITNANWSVSGTTATYKASATSAGYFLSSDGKTINYTNASGGNTLVTVSGLKSNAPVSGISLNGNTVTLSNSVLNQGTISVSNGYTLKLADDVPKSSITNANWSVSGTTATYKANATSAGYSLSNDGKTINYANASGGNTLVTVTGLKSNAPVSGISLNGNVVTLSNSVLNEGKVTVSNGYTLKLADDVPKSSITNANWSVSGTTATYKASATSAGYSLSSDGKTINYANASGGETFTITGLKNGLSVKNGKIEGISIKGNVVVVSSENVGNSEVKITGAGYTLEILKSANIPEGLSIKNNILTVSNKITDETINLNEEWAKNVEKINASAVSQKINILSNDSNISIKAGKGADTIFAGLGNDTLTGGAGNDVFIYEGGNDVITDYKVGEDKIRIGAITKSTVKGSDVILTTANGNLTVKGVKDKVVTFVDNNGKTTDKIFFADTSYTPLETGLTYDAKRTVLTASNKFKDNEINLDEYLDTVTKVNVSALSQNVNIVGNENNNSIKGGKNADTISGGNGKDTILGGTGNDSINGGKDNDKLQGEAGNDTLTGGTGNDTLTGGAGNDVFIYEGGNDIITDYKVGEDKIRIGAITKSTVKGSDVILTTSNGNLTVKGVKDKIVTFVDSNGKTTDKIFFADTSYTPLETGLTYDAKRTVLTASNKFTGNKIDLGEYLETVTKINSSATSQNLNIIGNSADNSIKAGKGADTIAGGNGNDTLTGGAGSDVFIYEGGNDVITDYKAGEDSIKINGTISKKEYSGKNVIFKIGSGFLTVSNSKDKEISVTDSSGTQIYSRTFNLLYDNNFMTEESQLDDVSAVTDKNYSVGQIEFSANVNDLANNTIVSAVSFDDK